MIGKTEIDGIDKQYFDIVEIKEFGIVLRSRCTGHFWYLMEQMCNNHKTFQIRHKHNISDSYHPQKNRPSIDDCCVYIMSHDAYHIRKMKRKEERSKKRFD